MSRRTGRNGENLPPATRLKALKVSQRTLNRYLACIEEFEVWCRRQGKKNIYSHLDRHVTAYINYLFDHDYELSTASYIIYGLQLLRCEVSKDAFLVGTKQSLAGWRKVDPGKMRMPVPEEFLWDLGNLAVEQGRLDVAMNLSLQYDGYMRPSECLTLHSSQVCPPAGKRYPHWAIVIAPSELHATTKTGTSDDSILIGDMSHNSWIRECMRLWMKRVPKAGGPLFPDLSLSLFEHWCRSACTELKYKSACVMPHVIRHSAASNDSYHKRRNLNEVKKRGRRECKKSVGRYSKHALLLHQWKQAHPSRVSTIEMRSQLFQTSFLTALRKCG